MTRNIGTDAEIDQIRLTQETAHPTSPDTGHEVLYIISGSPHGGLFVKDSSGRQIGPFITGTDSPAGTSIIIQNEGISLGTATTLNLVGNYVTASISGSVANIQIPQSIQDVPSTIRGLQLWLRSDFFSGFSNNQIITGTWQDYSGLENDASSVGSPIIKTNQLNGQPSVLLNGSSQYFIVKSPVGNPTICFFAVFNINSLAAAYTSIFGSVFADVFGYFIKSNGKSAEYYGGNNYDGTGAITFVTGTWNYISSNNSSTLFNTKRNGAVDKSAVTSFPPPNMANFLAYIGNQNVGSRLLPGNLVELIAYNRDLTDSEIAKIESYIQTRYGL